MPRPKLNEKQKKVRIAFRIDPLLFKKFEKQREKYSRTTTQWAEIAIQHYVEWVENHPLK